MVGENCRSEAGVTGSLGRPFHFSQAMKELEGFFGAYLMLTVYPGSQEVERTTSARTVQSCSTS